MLITHVITSLGDGGAEAVLFRLCTQSTDNRHVVISLTDEGKYGHSLRANGVDVHTLGISFNPGAPLAFLALIQLLRKYRPDVVQTWMYHSDLIGGVAARIAGIKAIAWGIRNTVLERGRSKVVSLLIAHLLARLSWWLPCRIVVCAQRAMEVHATLGYQQAIMRFIPNGYDLSVFTPGVDQAAALRAEWGVPSNMASVGSVARYDPYKDHSNLLRALSLLHSRKIQLCCVLVGSNVDADNRQLTCEIRDLGLQDAARLLGARTDIPAIMSAFDVFVLSSSAEAFPNVVAEAMACETPCVVTDVGDAAQIVGDTGWVVPPRDPNALAEAIETAVKESKQPSWLLRRVLARNRISHNFEIGHMVNAYHVLWQEMVAECAD